MLPPWIIEQLREREKTRREHTHQPQLELPAPELDPGRRSEPPEEPGVTIIPLWG